ncbi:MAG: sirohydrochlorin cobaltochelatase [Thermoproteota archaeon]|nr:sirohydrochlorin cobaltochelatase [Thermoproteota archaeon]
MKKALLIVDRGSKMKEVQQELFETCSKIREQTDYYYVDYCFLEVLPPFIEEGINKCLKQQVDTITVVPCFLYPGMKLKDAVKQTSYFTKLITSKIVITKPLSYQPAISRIVLDRVNSLLYGKDIKDNNYSLLLIGHGSSDRRARDAFMYTVKSLKTQFKCVNFCFLELEPPNIEEGIKDCLVSTPKSIFVIPYFLHKGIHIQNDILIEIDKAVKKYNFSNLYISEHIGVDSLIIDLIISLAKDAENKSGLFR